MDNTLVIIRKHSFVSNILYRDILNSDNSLNYWLEKESYGNYIHNDYLGDDKEYEILVNVAYKLKEDYLTLYEDMLELNDNHTLWEIRKEITPEEYFSKLTEKLELFESITGVEIFTEGRSGRHICIENTFENAYRYDELKKVQEKLEKDLIEELNR